MCYRKERSINLKHESEIYKGFYYVPTLPNTLINEKGQVIDLIKNWCPLIDINKDGYQCVNTDNNRRFIHRLLALTFLQEPDIPVTELDVNHIDGIKNNNSIKNLEWVTRSENCFHAYKTGLRTDNVPILVKDLRDGSITRYYSLHDCARAFNTEASNIHNELKDYNYGKLFKKYYILIKEGSEWPNVGSEILGQYRNGTAKTVLAYNPFERLGIIFESASKAAEHFGWKDKTLRMHISRNGKRLYHGWSFQYVNEILSQGNEIDLTELKSYLPEMVS